MPVLVRWRSFCILLLLVVTGCSVPYFGERHPDVAKARFTSSPQGMDYYLLTLAQNRKLAGRLSPIARADVPPEWLTRRHTRKTEPHWRLFAIGEYVLLLKCGEHFQRQRIQITDGMEQALSCSPL